MNYLAIPIQDLRDLLQCDFENGRLIWKRRPLALFATKRAHAVWNTRHAGKIAFAAPHYDGYLGGSIFGVKYRTHRVIYALYHGKWPDGEIDHINGNRSDNRIVNLRDVSSAENMRNHKRRKDNSSGVVGVYWRPDNQKWRAVIGTGNGRKTLGNFNSKEEAVAARHAASIQYNYHENHGRAA